MSSLTGTVHEKPITVPIEVKLASNSSVKKAMGEQLVERYMRQIDASHGVYIVVWMDASDRSSLKESHRPKWPDREAAEMELEEQARDLSSDNRKVRALVLDAALR